MFDKLPREIVISILLSAKLKDAVRLLSASKQLRAIDENPTFWGQMFATHFPVEFEAFQEGVKSHVEEDYKLAFKKIYESKIKYTFYECYVNVRDEARSKPEKEPEKFFEEVTSIFNNYINRTSPGPHIILGKKYAMTSSPIGRGLDGYLKLQLPNNFKLHGIEFSYANEVYPCEKISCANIVQFEPWSHFKNPIENPANKLFFKPKTTEEKLKRVENLLSKICQEVEGQFTAKFFGVLGINRQGEQFKNDLKDLLKNKIKYVDLFIKVHVLNRQASKVDKDLLLVKRLTEFFKEAGVADYKTDDDEVILMQKCQAANLISTTPVVNAVVKLAI